jgi:hypothetical protein
VTPVPTPRGSAPAGYSGTPLPRKLGIRPGSSVLLVGAPAGFRPEPLPEGVRITRRTPRAGSRSRFDTVLAFCPDAAGLARIFVPLMRLLDPDSALWVCWPKKASGVVTDLGENAVRDHGLAAGMVDVKVCAIDQTWSGLKFVYRVSDRPNVSSTQA